MMEREITADYVVNKYKGMVAEASWEVWKQLPARTKSWIEVDDLVMDGLTWAAIEVIGKFDRRRGPMGTWLYIGVRRYLRDEYVERYRAEHRDERTTASLTDRKQIEEVGAMENVLYHCWSVQLVTKVYQKASEELKAAIIQWFLGRDRGRLRLNTPKFQAARSEFRRLAKRERLGILECEYLMNSPECMDRLSRRLSNS